MNKGEYETITIKVDEDPKASTEGERLETMERFEEELSKLIKKYQGYNGLTFYAENSTGPIG